MRKWREQFRRNPGTNDCAQHNEKKLGFKSWMLVMLLATALFLGLSTVSFAQEGCTPEEIQDPENTDCMPAGDAQRGQLMFTGETSFNKSGAACVSCHNVTDTLSWGGGTLGPDLTGIVGRLSSEGVAGILSSLAFPTMAKVYEGKQLNKQEQADLLAFFVGANSRPASSFSWIQFWWGIGGFIVLLILQNVFWSQRFKGVRKKQIGGGN
ncbi:MAG: hypothetical protein OEY59_09730 [Deltaproteobacteria bacterium]|nr:hypothetical protein [Deltaproteobacteria bacterium]